MNTLIEINSVEELQNHWRDPYLQWWAAGMPSFRQPAKDPWKQIVIKFKNKEDREHFAQVFNYKLTDRTDVVSYPDRPRDPNSMSRYVEEGYQQDKYEETTDDDDE